MIGQRFGRYVVIQTGAPQGSRKRPRYLCQCDCGKQRLVTSENLKSGHSLSCGCISKYLCAIVGRQSFPRHGRSESPEYQIWANVKYWGAKNGFPVSWDNFEDFLADMGESPTARHRLRRGDLSGPFNKGNCFWAEPLSAHERENRRRACHEKWMGAHREIKRLHDRLFYEANKDRFLVYSRTRRARKRNAPGHHTQADIDWIEKAQRHRCAYCRVRLSKKHVDHIVPLVSKGHNGRRNLQILCPTCNLDRKSVV